MAVIEKRTGKDGSVSYRAKIRLKGFPPQSATFERKTDAKDWAQETEASIKNGRYFPNAQAKKRTLSDLLDLYLKSLKARNPKRYKDVQPLLEWWRKELGHAMLADLRSETLFKSQQKLSSRTSRRKDEEGKPKPVSNAYVNRYMVALNTALNFAVRTLQWIPRNPMDMVDNLQEPPGRTRFLSEDEIQRLMTACRESESPIMRDDLVAMLNYVPDTVKGHRDRALLLLGFCGAFRRSELVALKCTDLEFTMQGLIITLSRSKTDQTGQGRKIGIPKGRGKICAVQSLQNWLVHLSANDGPLFRSISKGGVISTDALSDRAVADIVKHYAAKTGLNPEKYSGHSLRSGLCSSAAQHGMSSWVIRKQSGHKSDAMLFRYIRLGDLFTDNAAALF